MIDLDELERLAKAAGAGQWSASDCTVWFDDGDGALRVGTPAMLGLAFDNMGEWPHPIDREDVAAFAASACPAAILELTARVRKAEAARTDLSAAVRRAILPLAHIASRDSLYQAAYEELSAIVDGLPECAPKDGEDA